MVDDSSEEFWRLLFVPGNVELVPHLPGDAVEQLPPDLQPRHGPDVLHPGHLQSLVWLRVAPRSVNPGQREERN